MGDISGGIRLLMGNFTGRLRSMNLKGRVAFMFFAIFHGLSDDESKTVLGNLKLAIGEKNPYILIADTVAEEMHVNPTVAAFDMQMLIGTRGRERTLSEWKQLLEGSGFEMVDVVDVRTFVKFIVASKRQGRRL